MKKKPTFQAADLEGCQRGRGGWEVDETCRRTSAKADHRGRRRKASIAAVRRGEGKAGKRQTDALHSRHGSGGRALLPQCRHGAAALVTASPASPAPVAPLPRSAAPASPASVVPDRRPLPAARWREYQGLLALAPGPGETGP